MNWPWLTNFGPFFQALAQSAPKIAADIKANNPLPPSKPLTSEAILAGIDQFEAFLARVKPILAAYPGEIRATDDLLEALEAEGFTWAASVEAGLNAAPAVVSEAASWLPTIRGFLAAIQPTPTYVPGPGQYRGR